MNWSRREPGVLSLISLIFTGSAQRTLCTRDTSPPFQDAVTFTKPEPTPAPHEHSFSDAWSYNELSHYRVCECGEHSEEAAHEFTWTVEKAAKRRSEGLRRGVCERCGFEKTETIPATGSGNARSRSRLVFL